VNVAIGLKAAFVDHPPPDFCRGYGGVGRRDRRQSRIRDAHALHGLGRNL